MKSLRTTQVDHKVIMVRVDFNVPMDATGLITDDTRIVHALPTIEYLCASGAKVLLLSHFRQPNGQRIPSMSLEPIGQALESYLQKPITFIRDCVGSELSDTVATMNRGDVALLENVRFHKGEANNDPTFSQLLASPADIFVNDAFSTSHRIHASVVGITQRLPSYPGFLLEREVMAFRKVLKHPKRPLVGIVGGAKISTKMAVIANLLKKFDVLLLGGAMANTFLAARGLRMETSLVETEYLDTARAIEQQALQTKTRLVLPRDGMMAPDSSGTCKPEARAVTDIPDGWAMLDIGPETTRFFSGYVRSANTIVWNGPMGLFEACGFADGTERIARIVARSAAFSLVGGGDSLAAVKSLRLEGSFNHLSTGGGASLEMLARNTLPGINALS